MAGVKETQELMIGAFVIAAFIIDRLKDGAGVDDIAALYAKMVSDEAFKKKVIDAAKGINEVPVEMKDFKLEELIGMAMMLTPELLGIMAKLPKETVDKLTKALSAIDVLKVAKKVEGGTK